MRISAIKIDGELLKDAIAKHFPFPGGVNHLLLGQSLAEIQPDHDGWLCIEVDSCCQQQITKWEAKQWVRLEFKEGMTLFVSEKAKISSQNTQGEKIHFTIEYKRHA